jgi:two-component system nitrogen regulation sensor histidine kinase GlnL
MTTHPVEFDMYYPVHVIVNQTDIPSRVLVELIEIEQQTRQDREERAATQAEANKELVRNLAHEIKNPLGGIRGAAQLLAMELGLTPSRELTEYTQVIINEADRLQALVDRLLAPHRARTWWRRQHPRGLRAGAVAAPASSRAARDRARLRHLHARVPRRPRAADPGRAEHRAQRRQALAERISAAMPADPAHPVARQVTIGKQRWRLALELHIEDNGPGVPEAIRDRIFYPLVSGRDGGTGPRAHLAQTFVQQHQGTIECDSVPGRTVFTLLIPLPDGLTNARRTLA